ncbi:hypothetical protein RYX36_024043 [Vicia faba]
MEVGSCNMEHKDVEVGGLSYGKNRCDTDKKSAPLPNCNSEPQVAFQPSNARFHEAQAVVQLTNPERSRNQNSSNQDKGKKLQSEIKKVEISNKCKETRKDVWGATHKSNEDLRKEYGIVHRGDEG